MSLDQIKTLHALSHCRTEAAGSILYRCTQCAKMHQVPKSCGNRHCPTCQGSKAKAWLEDQQARLLSCAYFMITFTVPKQFRPFMRSHPKECYRAIILMCTSSSQVVRSASREPSDFPVTATSSYQS